MAQYYEIEVSLQDTNPRLWRRIQIKKSLSFEHLHEAIQAACHWEDSHLFSFDTVGKRKRMQIASDPRESGYGASEAKPANRVKLSSFFDSAKKCIYTYDFGDNWEHEIKLIREFESDEKFTRRLIDGEGIFPPEDCGGIPGYYDCLEAVSKKRGDKELLDWLGDWNPKNFRLTDIQSDYNC